MIMHESSSTKVRTCLAAGPLQAFVLGVPLCFLLVGGNKERNREK